MCALLHGDISNDLDGPLSRFQGHGIFEVEYLKKWCILGAMLLKNTNRKPSGLLILQYNIAILSIANTIFSIAKVLQYFLKICIGIGIANTFFLVLANLISTNTNTDTVLEHTITQQNCGYVW